MADIFYTDAPTIDGTTHPWPAAEPARAHRRLRRWHKAVLATVLLLALPVGLYLVGWASLELAGIGAAVMLLELAAWLLLAWRFGRL